MPPKPKPKTPSSTVATRIEGLRESLGMTQTAFAEALGLERPSSVSKWEAAKNKPGPAVLARMARLADGEDKLFFLEEAGVGQYLEGAPMLGGVKRAVAETVADALRAASATFGGYSMDDAPRTIHLLKNPEKLGDPHAVQAENVELALNLPLAWFPADSDVQAVRFEGNLSPFIGGDLIALVDVSRRDPDRLIGCIVAVRTPGGVEPMTLRKDGRTSFLVPLREGAEHPVRVLRHDGAWSILGRVLKWIGDAPPAGK